MVKINLGCNGTTFQESNVVNKILTNMSLIGAQESPVRVAKVNLESRFKDFCNDLPSSYNKESFAKEESSKPYDWDSVLSDCEDFLELEESMNHLNFDENEPGYCPSAISTSTPMDKRKLSIQNWETEDLFGNCRIKPKDLMDSEECDSGIVDMFETMTNDDSVKALSDVSSSLIDSSSPKILSSSISPITNSSANSDDSTSAIIEESTRRPKIISIYRKKDFRIWYLSSSEDELQIQHYSKDSNNFLEVEELCDGLNCKVKKRRQTRRLKVSALEKSAVVSSDSEEDTSPHKVHWKNFNMLKLMGKERNQRRCSRSLELYEEKDIKKKQNMMRKRRKRTLSELLSKKNHFRNTT